MRKIKFNIREKLRHVYFICAVVFLFSFITRKGLAETILTPGYFHSFTVGDYKASPQNWDLTTSPDGILYVANNSGLLTFDGNNWELHTLPDYSEILQVKYRNDTIYTRNEHTNGYWLYDHYGKLYYTALNDTLISLFSTPEPNHYILPKEIINSYPSAFATLKEFNYIGTFTNGLYITDLKGNILMHLTDNYQLQDNIVYAIHTTEPNQIWVAFDNGLNQITVNSAIRLLGKRNRLGKLEDAWVENNDLFIQTNIGYFKRSLSPLPRFMLISPDEITHKRNRVEAVTRWNELFTDTTSLGIFSSPNTITPTIDNKYWLTKGDEAALFKEENGKGILECRVLFDDYRLNLVNHEKQIIPLNDSLHLISTLEGIVLLNTNILKRVKDQNPPTIKKIYYKDEQNTHYLPTDIASIILPPDLQTFTIQVATGIYTPNNYISYQIEGFSSNWSAWQQGGNISLLKLPAGKYNLKIRRYIPVGDFPEITLSIEIKPTWYTTIWAYLFYIISLWIILQIFIYSYRKRQQQEKERQEQLLRREEAEKMQQLKHEMLQEEIQIKNRELLQQTSLLLKKSRLVHALMEELEEQKKTMGERYPNKLYKKLRTMMENVLEDQEDWMAFESYFNATHHNFIERLKEVYPELTTSDLRMASLLRMNLSTKEIASILNVSIRAIELRRYRLRKRIGLDSDTNLLDYFLNF